MDEIFTKPGLVITIRKHQWDIILKVAYDAGHLLLLLNKNEQPVKAYRKAVNHDYVG
jgi:hypothetical protein